MRQFCFPPLLALHPGSHLRLSSRLPLSLSLDLSGWRFSSTSLTRTGRCLPPYDLQWQVCARLRLATCLLLLDLNTIDGRLFSWASAFRFVATSLLRDNSSTCTQNNGYLVVHALLVALSKRSEVRQRLWKTSTMSPSPRVQRSLILNSILSYSTVKVDNVALTLPQATILRQRTKNFLLTCP